MAEEKILQRVQKLLDLANHPNTPPHERDAAIRRADGLMVKHAIDEAMLDATLTKDERRKPVREVFKAAEANAEYWERFRTVLREIARLQRVRVAFHYNGETTLIGFRDDVEYVKMKWLSIYLHFTKTIDPTWDFSLTIDHNVYNFKTAGRRWEDIQSIMFGVTGIDKPMHFFKPSYRRHCKTIGEEPRRHTQRNFAYRNSFTEGFISRICARIEEMISERDKTTAESGTMVLMKDVQHEVDEEFYRLFPHHRPMSQRERDEWDAKFQADAEKDRRELEEKLEAMSADERREYERKRQAEMREEAKRNRQYWRDYEKTLDQEGASMGQASANKVDLNRHASADAAATRKEL